MSDLAAAPDAPLIWATPAGNGRVDIHLPITLPEGPAIAVVHADSDQTRAFARSLLAAAGDGFERTMSTEVRS
ncbi:hypothetical protein [Methylobacterium organophilum]|uniref:Uncharacterized protein n=1 Tax=Methylobacterium organophilum TaxID=410 RepID=A0ABQ4TFE2_METOR|nr:hypothetical protein [Methylobacterium organophilum]GJE29771.1 hypothetical protein LKMONMHP_4657 [Methylobacterium organophilum]